MGVQTVVRFLLFHRKTTWNWVLTESIGIFFVVNEIIYFIVLKNKNTRLTSDDENQMKIIFTFILGTERVLNNVRQTEALQQIFVSLQERDKFPRMWPTSGSDRFLASFSHLKYFASMLISLWLLSLRSNTQHILEAYCCVFNTTCSCSKTKS